MRNGDTKTRFRRGFLQMVRRRAVAEYRKGKADELEEAKRVRRSSFREHGIKVVIAAAIGGIIAAVAKWGDRLLEFFK